MPYHANTLIYTVNVCLTDLYEFESDPVCIHLFNLKILFLSSRIHSHTIHGTRRHTGMVGTERKMDIKAIYKLNGKRYRSRISFGYFNEICEKYIPK